MFKIGTMVKLAETCLDSATSNDTQLKILEDYFSELPYYLAVNTYIFYKINRHIHIHRDTYIYINKIFNFQRTLTE